MSKKKKLSSLEDLGGLIYSTSSESIDNHDENDLPETPDPEHQKLEVWFEKKGRAGKAVTIIRGYQGHEDDLKLLAKELKNSLGIGGSCKNEEIILQGSVQQKTFDWLINKGYKAKKVGG